MTWPVLSSRDAILLDGVAALATHAFYNRFEPNPSKRPFTTFLLLIASPSLVTTFLYPYFSSPFITLCISFSLFYAILLSSIVLYRISPFHPLSRYPGPFLAKITKFWGMWKMYDGKNHIHHKKLHEKYGPCVRVGPNELSLIAADTFVSIFGADGLPKGPVWDARGAQQGTQSLLIIRDPHEHARRRKPWNRAFNIAAIKDYEPILARRALQLADELEKKTRTSEAYVDLAEWLKAFSFDFMGDMAFGGGFETMRDGADKNSVWRLVEEGMVFVGLIQHTPWIAHLLSRIPAASKTINVLRQFAYDASLKRKMSGSNTKDIFYYLINEDGIGKERITDAEVLSDGLLAIVAGSDTTSHTLSGLFCQLLQHPADYKRLQEEVDQYFPLSDGDPFDAAKLAGMPFLNAVINEALRVCSPGNILQRGTTSETGSRWLGEYYVPEGTAVSVAFYAATRDPRYFSPAPEEFWPERWIRAQSSHNPDILPNKAETGKDNANSSPAPGADADAPFIHDTAAFLPFSYGPANCAGRNLAILELRVVVALLMQRFKMRLAKEFDPHKWEEDIEDWFVMKVGKLPVVLFSRV
ncbi:hypothetical protein M0805_006640 [Coniferiporia weirii]|nr:hypothetical protein M0805_006640 [Coniferiporia weirii]